MAVYAGSELVIEPGEAVVRGVIAVEMEVTDGGTGFRVETEGDGRSDGEAADLRLVASGDAGFKRHDIDADGSTGGEIGEGLVEVGGEATGFIGAELRLGSDECLILGDFAFLVDDASGGAATELYAGGTFEDVDLLIVEGVAEVAAEVAYAVEEDVVAGGEAADGEIVALSAGFASGEGDAGDVAEGVAEGGDTLILEQGPGDNCNGLRRFDEWLSEFLHGD